ncbi:hypothetical protein C2S52_002153 [Perilla frutescens var. hirtella]|nr:hypothetical protein C2S52_002153 [Perilla frutescens var. hirtella]
MFVRALSVRGDCFEARVSEIGVAHTSAAMRKKLDTRFPASRIKKIMQADEDVGKIAMAVPLLVSKALELFLQDLCDRTYDVTLQRGAKTLNSLHLKQCVQSFNVFDFLRDTVSKVPDLGGADAANEDRSATKRRKVSDDEECGNEDGSKKMCMRESDDQYEKLEDGPDISNHNCENQNQNLERPSSVVAATSADSRTTGGKDADKSVVTFDLNVQLNENGDSAPTLDGALSNSSEKPSPGAIHEDIPGWSLDNVEKLAIDPVQLANLNGGTDEEDEDYDEEG